MSRMTILRKRYTYENGETGRSAKPNWTKLTFEFLAPKKDADDNPVVVETREIDRADMEKNHADMVACAIGHGLSQKFGDELAGIAGKASKQGHKEDKEIGFVAFALELWDGVMANLMADVWVAEGEGSSGAGNVTILLEAIQRTFKAAGKELDETGVAKVRESLKDEDYRKKARGRADIASNVAAITAERAAERAAKAEAAAKDADTGELADLL